MCRSLGIPIRFPNQLRHNAATEIRRRFGLEASQAVLGHSELATSQIYAEVDNTTAYRIMSKTGSYGRTRSRTIHRLGPESADEERSAS